MKRIVKDIRGRHDRSHYEFSVDELSLSDDLINVDDISFNEWLAVHKDREVLLNEIDRLYRLLRSKRRLTTGDS